jgi:hypothetical protein
VIRRGIISVLATVFWGALLYLGVTVTANAFRQAVAGFPNSGQLRFYIFFPEAMTLLSACLTLCVNKLPKPLFVVLSLTQFALIPPYLFFYTGGI